MTPEDAVVKHEAAHAVACVLLAIPCHLVDTVGNHRTKGFVRHDTTVNDTDDARKHMIMTVAGFIMADAAPIPTWPLDDDDDGSDECWLAKYAKAMNFTESDWHGLLAEAYRFTATPEFELMFQATTGMLSHTPRIGPGTLEVLHAIAKRAAT